MLTFLSRSRRLAALTMIVSGLSLAALQVAEARVGGGGSSGSRGSRTNSAPASTNTAPAGAQPMQRTVTQPGQTAPAATAARPSAPAGAQPSLGRSLMTGVFAGLIGAGIFGLLSGSGFFSGLGSLSGILGFLLQVGLLVLAFVIIRRMFFSRSAQPAMAGVAPGPTPQPQANVYARAAMGPSGGDHPPVEIGSQDYDAFQRALTLIQTAYGREDVGTLRMQTTPEMAAYFEQDLADNSAKGVLNRIGEVTLLNGDLSEAWQEQDAQYATVAMRYSIADAMIERGTGRVVEGDLSKPQIVTELWTFRRGPREAWKLSAIQQTN